MPVVFREVPNVVGVVERIGKPGLRPAAVAIQREIPTFVPVQSGNVQSTYRPTVSEDADSYLVHVNSSFWHFLEYGTATNPPYRPVERAVRSLGLRYEAH